MDTLSHLMPSSLGSHGPAVCERSFSTINSVPIDRRYPFEVCSYNFVQWSQNLAATSRNSDVNYKCVVDGVSHYCRWVCGSGCVSD